MERLQILMASTEVLVFIYNSGLHYLCRARFFMLQNNIFLFQI